MFGKTASYSQAVGVRSDREVGEGTGGNRFLPVRVGSLRVDSFPPFDLFVRQTPQSPYVLYREKNLCFTDAARGRLEENSVSTLYIPDSQFASYQDYVEGNLSRILADPAIPIREKSEILYGSAMGLSQEIFANPRSGAIFSRCGELVRHEVSFIIEQQDAFENLVKVTSYDYYTYTHSVNVSLFSIATAHALGHGQDEILRIGNGALLHDIGKTMVPPAILNCPGKLSSEAWQVMQRHPVYGHNILKRQGCDDGIILDMVRHHHEKLTGHGYPDHLDAVEVSRPARIGMIADVFDALTTRRSYKDALSAFAAVQLMQAEMMGDLDGVLFRCFVELVGRSCPARGQQEVQPAD